MALRVATPRETSPGRSALIPRPTLPTLSTDDDVNPDAGPVPGGEEVDDAPGGDGVVGGAPRRRRILATRPAVPPARQTAAEAAPEMLEYITVSI